MNPSWKKKVQAPAAEFPVKEREKDLSGGLEPR